MQSEDKDQTVRTSAAGAEVPGTVYDAAVDAARAGQFVEATRLLVRAEEFQECTGAEALDLHARILAQQGMYADAEQCWRKAGELDPGNPAYELGIARIRRTSRSGLPVSITALTIALAAVLGLLLWQTLVAIPALRASQAEVSGRLAGLAGDFAAGKQAGQQWEAACSRDLAGISVAVSSVAAETDSLRVAARAMEGRARELDRRTAAIAHRVDALGAHTDELAEGLSRLVSARLTSLESQLTGTATTAGLDTLAATVAAMQSELSEIRTMVGGKLEPGPPPLSPQE